MRGKGRRLGDDGAGKGHLRLISIGEGPGSTRCGGYPVVLKTNGDDRRESAGRIEARSYRDISAVLDTALLPEPRRDTGAAIGGFGHDEARRLLRIGGRLRKLAEKCLDPAAPALERLGRTVELSGRRRLFEVVPTAARPDAPPSS